LTEIDSYLVRIFGGGLLSKIAWDWLKVRKQNSNGNASVSKGVCDEKHNADNERHERIERNISKLFTQSKETGECVARIEGYLKKD